MASDTLEGNCKIMKKLSPSLSLSLSLSLSSCRYYFLKLIKCANFIDTKFYQEDS